jgi:hypothetical protein
MKKIMQIIAVPVLLVIGAVGWSLINKQTSIKIDPTAPTPLVEKQAMPTKTVVKISPTIAPEVTTAPLVYANPSVTIDAFETAIPAKKYSDLSEFMTSNVTLIKYATSCCGLITKAQAIKEMAYLSGAVGPWNFEDNNPIAARLAASDPDNFRETFVGTSANNYTVGLVLNDSFLISKVILVGDYHLITGP